MSEPGALPAFDIAIVGAGIAGASLAWQLAPRRSVLLLERESQPGLHSTGRSAAMFMESYGTPQVRALTRAGRALYTSPPAGFCDAPILAPRGALYVAWRGQEAALEALWLELRATGTAVRRLDAGAVLERVPVLRAEGLVGAIDEPDAMDIDVHTLHQGFLRGARRQGATLWTDAEVVRAERRPTAYGASWTLHLADGRQAGARVLVNAAGAWADDLAARAGVRPLGLRPKRRSALTFDAPPGIDARKWPVTASVDESWYFKPDAGQLLGSPANADPVPPHDVQPEEIDIATGIARIEAATTLAIRRPRRTWAGLRTFAPDGDLVIGFDPCVEGFFWLAGQGGYGIQSAAGAALLAACLLRGEALPEELRREGVEPQRMAPARLAPAG
jgi:D-arginine dehydrogenase